MAGALASIWVDLGIPDDRFALWDDGGGDGGGMRQTRHSEA